MTGCACFKWVSLDLTGKQKLDGLLPAGAVIAGWERGKPTHVGRVLHEGHWELGKLNDWARFSYSWMGEEIEASRGELLVSESHSSPVWFNGAYGEGVENVMTSKSRDHIQLIGRAWHRDRWVPGKVVPFCRRFYFAFGGREMSTRKYQLLSSEFAWAHLLREGGLPTHCVPVDNCMPPDSLNCLLLPTPHCYPRVKQLKVLTHSGSQECQWVVSGDGEYLRHALTNEDGYQLARAWVDGARGTGHWVEGTVQDGAFRAGMYLRGNQHVDYQVLVSSPIPARPCSDNSLSSRLLSLSVSLETLEGMLENDLTPPESIFMLTRLEPGEEPWAAVKEMVTQDKDMQSKLPKRLRSVMPLTQGLAAGEGNEEESRDLLL